MSTHSTPDDFRDALHAYNTADRFEKTLHRVTIHRSRIAYGFIVALIISAVLSIHGIIFQVATAIILSCTIVMILIWLDPAIRRENRASKITNDWNEFAIHIRLNATLAAIDEARNDPMMPIDDDVLDAVDHAMIKRI